MRPGRRLACPRLSLRALEPDRKNRNPPWILVHEHLDQIEQRRDSLDLIDENGLLGLGKRIQFRLEALRIGHVIAEDAGPCEVDAEIGLKGGEEGRLPHLAWPQQEDAPLALLDYRSESSFVHVGK